MWRPASTCPPRAGADLPIPERPPEWEPAPSISPDSLTRCALVDRPCPGCPVAPRCRRGESAAPRRRPRRPGAPRRRSAAACRTPRRAVRRPRVRRAGRLVGGRLARRAACGRRGRPRVTGITSGASIAARAFMRASRIAILDEPVLSSARSARTSSSKSIRRSRMSAFWFSLLLREDWTTVPAARSAAALVAMALAYSSQTGMLIDSLSPAT